MNKDVPAFLEKPKPEGTQRWIHVNGGRSWDGESRLARSCDYWPLAEVRSIALLSKSSSLSHSNTTYILFLSRFLCFLSGLLFVTDQILQHILHHGNKSTRSKVDYYKQHLFVSITVHKPAAADSEDDLQSYFKSNPAFAPSYCHFTTFLSDPRVVYSSAPKKEVKSSSSKMPAPPRKMGALSHEKYNLALVSAFMQYVLSPAKPKRTVSSHFLSTML